MLFEIQHIKEMSDKEFLKCLYLIFPSKRINRTLLKELERRNIRNNPHVLKYLLQLKKFQIDLWTIHKLLIVLFDVSHKSNKFIKNTFVPQITKTKVEKYNIREVYKSLKQSKLSSDFIIFVTYLEKLLTNLNFVVNHKKDNLLVESSGFIIDFIDLACKFKHKRKYKISINEGFFHLKKTWLYALKNRIMTNQILFFILVNTRNSTELKVKIVGDAIKRHLAKSTSASYKEMCNVFWNIEERYNKYLVTDRLDFDIVEKQREKEPKMRTFKFCINPAKKTIDTKSLEWFKMRTDGIYENEQK